GAGFSCLTCGWHLLTASSGRTQHRYSVYSALARTDCRTGVGELTVLLASWRLHLEASNLSPLQAAALLRDAVAILKARAELLAARDRRVREPVTGYARACRDR